MVRLSVCRALSLLCFADALTLIYRCFSWPAAGAGAAALLSNALWAGVQRAKERRQRETGHKRQKFSSIALWSAMSLRLIQKNAPHTQHEAALTVAGAAPTGNNTQKLR